MLTCERTVLSYYIHTWQFYRQKHFFVNVVHFFDCLMLGTRLNSFVDTSIDQRISLNVHINMSHYSFVQANNQSEKRNSKCKSIGRFYKVYVSQSPESGRCKSCDFFYKADEAYLTLRWPERKMYRMVGFETDITESYFIRIPTQFVIFISTCLRKEVAPTAMKNWIFYKSMPGLTFTSPMVHVELGATHFNRYLLYHDNKLEHWILIFRNELVSLWKIDKQCFWKSSFYEIWWILSFISS